MTEPFEYSEDAVTAKLSIDIPSTAIDDVSRLTREFQLLRTELEAASRTQADFLEYLKEVPEISERATQAQRSYTSQLERGSLVQQEINSSTRGASRQAPGHFVDHFANSVEGLGGRVQSTTPESVRQTLEQLDSRQIENMSAQRGYKDPLEGTSSHGSRKGSKSSRDSEHSEHGTGEGRRSSKDPSPETSYDWQDESLSREERLGKLGESVLEEMGSSGGNGAGAGARLGVRGLGSIFGGGGSGGGGGLGGLGGAAKGAGVAGGIVAGLVGVNNALQSAGEKYQGYKNIGLLQGGGAAEGIGAEIQAYTMAISPFINTEQSRQIVQQAMSEGYHGKQFDTVTQMVAENFGNFGKDITQTFNELRKQVIEGGQTFEGYKAQQTVMKNMAKESEFKSLPQIQQEVASLQGAAIDSGASSETSETFAELAVGMYSDDQRMQGVATKIHESLAANNFDNPFVQEVMFYARKQGVSIPQNTRPWEFLDMVGAEAFTKYAWGCLRDIAKRYRSVGGFYDHLRAIGVNINQNDAKDLYTNLMEGGRPEDGLKESREKIANTRITSEKDQEYIRDQQKRLTGVSPSEIDPDGAKGKRSKEDQENHDRYNSFNIDSLIDTFGRSGVEVIDSRGNVQDLDPQDEGMGEDLRSGKTRWRRKGDSGPGFTLEESRGINKDNYKEKSETKVSGKLKIEIDRQGNVTVPAEIELTPHQDQVNSGYGDATANNPPPKGRKWSR